LANLFIDDKLGKNGGKGSKVSIDQPVAFDARRGINTAASGSGDEQERRRKKESGGGLAPQYARGKTAGSKKVVACGSRTDPIRNSTDERRSRRVAEREKEGGRPPIPMSKKEGEPVGDRSGAAKGTSNQTSKTGGVHTRLG